MTQLANYHTHFVLAFLAFVAVFVIAHWGGRE